MTHVMLSFDMDRDDRAYPGQSDYTRPLLKVSDPLVLGLAAPDGDHPVYVRNLDA